MSRTSESSSCSIVTNVLTADFSSHMRTERNHLSMSAHRTNVLRNRIYSCVIIFGKTRTRKAIATIWLCLSTLLFCELIKPINCLSFVICSICTNIYKYVPIFTNMYQYAQHVPLWFITIPKTPQPNSFPEFWTQMAEEARNNPYLLLFWIWTGIQY